MTAVRAAGGLRPDNAHVATLVRLNGGWLLVIVAWSRCRRRSLPSPHSNRRRGSNEMGLCSGHPFRPPAGHSFTRIDRDTQRRTCSKNIERSRDGLSVASFGTRGSQFQILPLRPAQADSRPRTVAGCVIETLDPMALPRATHRNPPRMRSMCSNSIGRLDRAERRDQSRSHRKWRIQGTGFGYSAGVTGQQFDRKNNTQFNYFSARTGR